MLALHIRALTELALPFLAGMIAQRSGGVINVNSIVARLAGLKIAIYNAVKAHIRVVFLALAGELVGTGVTLIAVSLSRETLFRPRPPSSPGNAVYCT